MKIADILKPAKAKSLTEAATGPLAPYLPKQRPDHRVATLRPVTEGSNSDRIIRQQIRKQKEREKQERIDRQNDLKTKTYSDPPKNADELRDIYDSIREGLNLTMNGSIRGTVRTTEEIARACDIELEDFNDWMKEAYDLPPEAISRLSQFAFPQGSYDEKFRVVKFTRYWEAGLEGGMTAPNVPAVMFSRVGRA